ELSQRRHRHRSSQLRADSSKSKVRVRLDKTTLVVVIVTGARTGLRFERTQLVGVRFEKSSNNHCDNQKTYSNQSLAHQDTSEELYTRSRPLPPGEVASAKREPDRAKPKATAGEGSKAVAMSIPLPALRADLSQRERRATAPLFRATCTRCAERR